MTSQLESLRRFVAQHPVPPVPSPAGGAVVVAGGKGGVGTSLCAALLALGGSLGARVLLVDASAGFGTLSLLFDLDGGAGLAGLRGGGRAVEECVLPVTDTLSLLPAGSGDEPLPAAERQALLRRVSSLYPRYDLVVLDAGARLDAVLAACTAGAARLLAVTTPERIALTATYALAKVAAERFPALQVELLVNRADIDEARPAAEQLGAATRHFLRRAVAPAGVVPEDPSLRAAIDAGMHLCDAAVGSPAATTLEEISSTMLRTLSAGPLLGERRHPQPRS